MIELTQEQRHAIAGAESPVILDPETKQSYVLIRKEVFDRIKGLLYDDSEWTPMTTTTRTERDYALEPRRYCGGGCA